MGRLAVRSALSGGRRLVPADHVLTTSAKRISVDGVLLAHGLLLLIEASSVDDAFPRTVPTPSQPSADQKTDYKAALLRQGVPQGAAPPYLTPGQLICASSRRTGVDGGVNHGVEPDAVKGLTVSSVTFLAPLAMYGRPSGW